MKVALLMLWVGVLGLVAQPVKFPAALDDLATRAAETTNITLDGNLLQLVGRPAPTDNPDQAKAKKLMIELKGIYIRSYRFNRDDQYTIADIEPILAQLRAPEWSRAGVTSRLAGIPAELYIRREGDQIAAVTILAIRPKELVIVAIDGPLPLEALSVLSGNMGVPKMEIIRERQGR